MEESLPLGSHNPAYLVITELAVADRDESSKFRLALIQESQQHKLGLQQTLPSSTDSYLLWETVIGLPLDIGVGWAKPLRYHATCIAHQDWAAYSALSHKWRHTQPLSIISKSGMCMIAPEEILKLQVIYMGKMNGNGIVLSKISKAQREKYCMLSVIYGS